MDSGAGIVFLFPMSPSLFNKTWSVIFFQIPYKEFCLSRRGTGGLLSCRLIRYHTRPSMFGAWATCRAVLSNNHASCDCNGVKAAYIDIDWIFSRKMWLRSIRKFAVPLREFYHTFLTRQSQPRYHQHSALLGLQGFRQ